MIGGLGGPARRRRMRAVIAFCAALLMAATSLVMGDIGRASAAVPTARIVVHADGDRIGPASAAGLAGVRFEAVQVRDSGVRYECTTGANGSCAMDVATGTGAQGSRKHAYAVRQIAAPDGWYLHPALDVGSSQTSHDVPYTFLTRELARGSVTNVPSSHGTRTWGTAMSVSRANPALSPRCGLNMALILDSSGSMQGRKLDTLKSAAKSVIGSLTGTPSRLAIYSFASHASAHPVALTKLTDAQAEQPLFDAIDSLRADGSTNWDEGIYQAVGKTKQYDLAIVLTDGNPTTDHAGGAGRHTSFRNVDNGVLSANTLKALGTRVVAIGIGVDGGGHNLSAISGPNGWTGGGPATPGYDYYLAGARDFGAIFTSFATGTCENTLSVHNQLQGPDGTPLTDSPDANGWSFAAAITGSSAVGAFPLTGSAAGTSGSTQTTVSIPAGASPTVTVREHLREGYTFVSARCLVDGEPAANQVVDNGGQSPGVSFAAIADVPLSCTFVNRAPAQQQHGSTLTVRKTDEHGTPLTGATFALHAGSAAGPVVGTCTTAGSGGTCTVAGVPLGSYVWVETRPPAGFELPDDPSGPAIVITAVNAGTGTIPPSTFVDRPSPAPTLRTALTSAVQNPDGTWTITYGLAVSSGGGKYPGVYSLSDVLAFGSGVRVESASVAGPGARADWTGVAPHAVVVADQAIAVAATARYTVIVTATVTAAAGAADRDCTLGAGEPGTGFRNAATITTTGGEHTETACAAPVSPLLDKQFDSVAQHDRDGVWDGTRDVAYTLTVTNPSRTTAVRYSLSDTPELPAGWVINAGSARGTDGSSAIAGLASDWRGGTTAIVSGRELAAGGSDTYTVLINVSVPTTATSLECNGNPGHGLFNRAVLSSGADTFTADACGDLPRAIPPILAKTVTGNQQNADGTWAITYDLAVTNPDTWLATRYDLSDVLDFGRGITVRSAGASGPTSTSGPAADWDGGVHTALALDRTLAAGASEHYTVRVVAAVGASAGAADRDCVMDPGEQGTGFRNTATLTSGTHRSATDACVSPGAPTVVKKVVSALENPQWDWTIDYTVTVANHTDRATSYSLRDVPGFPAGVQVTSASASWQRTGADATPGLPAAVPGWTGTGAGATLADRGSLPAGATDTYYVTVRARVSHDVDATLLPCSDAGAGHGFFNAAVLSSGGDVTRVSACAPGQARDASGVSAPTVVGPPDGTPVTGSPVPSVIGPPDLGAPTDEPSGTGSSTEQPPGAAPSDEPPVSTPSVAAPTPSEPPIGAGDLGAQSGIGSNIWLIGIFVALVLGSAGLLALAGWRRTR